MIYEIEKGIEFEKTVSTSAKYPFAGMDVGNSFLVEDGNEKFVVRSAAYAYAKAHPPIKFATKTTEDGNVRVWRIK